MEREQINDSSQRSPEENETVKAVTQPAVPKIDDLLADIDAVLEQNSQEFVNNFIQKGGQ